MLMLTAYFDESGTHENSEDFLTIAGYLSSVDLWERFELEWLTLLKDPNFNIPYSHAVEMAHFKGPFSSWDSAIRLAFEKQAHEIIKRNTWKSFDMSLNWAEYHACIPTYVGNNPPPAYAILVNAVLLEVGNWLTAQQHYEPVDYVMEQGVDAQGWVFRAYNKATLEIASGKMHLRSLSFAEGKKWIDVPPRCQLQAADMNAYEINKNRKDVLSGRQQLVGRIRGSLDNLRSHDPETNLLTKSSLMHTLRELEKKDI